MSGERPGRAETAEAPGRAVLEAPAKINLHLQVLGRRADGYHELVTVLQTIELCDEVRLALRPRRAGQPGVALELLAGPPDLPLDRRNLAVEAAIRLLDRAGAEGDLAVEIGLAKRIPVGGGLGGGSSDAAAVLAGLNRLLGEPLGDRELAALAASLGSDVPFFLQGGTALCTGRGEIVRPIAPPRPFELTLVIPPFPVATARVYAALAAQSVPVGATPTTDELVERIADAGTADLDQLYRNDLEPAARRVEPRLEEWLDTTGMHLSGSGSTLFQLGRVEPDSALECPSGLICWTRSRFGKA
jgi:4-diphosphocytidyl-2-C-methyl-D-erythritol kinase